MDGNIFISHKTDDKQHALHIKQFLVENGYSPDLIFLDSERIGGILPGNKWEETLYQKLQSCVCLIVIGTENWVKSRWCFAEAFIAKNCGIPVLPLRIDKEADLSFLTEFQSLDFDSFSANDLQSLLDILRQHKLAPPGSVYDSTGWVTSKVQMSIEQKRDLFEELKQQLGSLRVDWLVRVLLIGVFVLTLGLTTFIMFGSQIYEFLHPPQNAAISTLDFVTAVKVPQERSVLIGKRVCLTGSPAQDYSSAKPRIALDNIVSININSMQNGALIPDQILGRQCEITCTVQAVNPLEIEGNLLQVIVYVADASILNIDD